MTGERRLSRARTGQGCEPGDLYVSTSRARTRDGLRPRLHQPVRPCSRVFIWLALLPSFPPLPIAANRLCFDSPSSPDPKADLKLLLRMMQYCCDPKLCPCGPDRCSNLPLSKREGVPVAKDGLVVIWVRNPPLPKRQ